MSWKRTAWRAVMLAVLALVAIEIYNRIPVTISWDQLRTLQPSAVPLVGSVILLVGANVLHAFLWRRMSVDLGSPAPNARATLHIYFVSSLSRYLMKLGQVAGLAVLANRFGMAAGRATAAALLAEVIKMSTGFLLVGATMHGISRQLDLRLPIDPAWIGILIAVATIGAIWAMAGTAAGLRVRQALIGRLRGRMRERLGSAFATLDSARPRDAAVWTAGYMASWILVAAAFVLFVGSFVHLEPSQIAFVGGSAALSYLLGYFSFLPAGLVMREGSMFILLDLIMPATAALTISVLSRFWYTAGEILPLLLIPISGRRVVIAPHDAGSGAVS